MSGLTLMDGHFRELEINGGEVKTGRPLRLRLVPVDSGYADAQIDDYGGRKRSEYPWSPRTTMELRARFSHPIGKLVGTAGFGFWNAPFGDPTVPWPALPQATWFFYASESSDLPLSLDGPGHGWFVSTIDAKTVRATVMVPLAPAVVLLNNVSRLRSAIWPAVRRGLKISFQVLKHDMTDWHVYRLEWSDKGCLFWVDGLLEFETQFSPSGPLGFVCWLDNQYMVATPTGRIRWGTLPVVNEQWMELSDLRITRF